MSRRNRKSLRRASEEPEDEETGELEETIFRKDRFEACVSAWTNFLKNDPDGFWDFIADVGVTLQYGPEMDDGEAEVLKAMIDRGIIVRDPGIVRRWTSR